MSAPANLYELTIDNATLQIGKAVRYFSYQHLVNKSQSSIVGRLWKTESSTEDTYKHYLSFGRNKVAYLDNIYIIEVTKTGEPMESLNQVGMYPFSMTIWLLETEKTKLGDDDYYACRMNNVKDNQDRKSVV